MMMMIKRWESGGGGGDGGVVWKVRFDTESNNCELYKVGTLLACSGYE